MASLFSALAALLAGCRPAAEATPVSDPYHADLRALTELLTRHWSYLEHRRELSGVDLARLEERALAELGADPTPRDFLLALTRYVAGLCDGHAGVEWEGASLATQRRLPFTLADAAEGVIIAGLAPGLAGPDLPAVGDLLLAIDERPIEEWIAEREERTCASTAGARRAQALLMLPTEAAGESARLRYLHAADGEEACAELPCPPADTPIGARGLLPLWRRELAMLEEGIGYFRPGSFRPPEDSGWSGATPPERDAILAESYDELRRVLDELAEARVLVLDLRGNPGGTDLLGQELAGLLLAEGSVYFQLQGRGEDGRWYRRSSHRVRPARDREPWEGPLVCLIDEGTFSTADNFAACLRDEHPDVTFVGRPAGAGTGAPQSFELPHTGARVWCCTQRVFSPSGAPIEGIGVVPDVVVRPTREELLAERDPALERALEIARARRGG